MTMTTTEYSHKVVGPFWHTGDRMALVLAKDPISSNLPPEDNKAVNAARFVFEGDRVMHDLAEVQRASQHLQPSGSGSRQAEQSASSAKGFGENIGKSS
jgi:hypothetical protein